MSDNIATEEASRRLECMEIWDGNQATDITVSVTGIDCWSANFVHCSGGVHPGTAAIILELAGSSSVLSQSSQLSSPEIQKV